jgi:hypothetical protein
MNVRFILSFFLIVTLIMVPGRAADRLSLTVSPAVAFAPANLTIRATVPSAADNQAIRFVAESPDYYRASEIGLEGDQAPRTTLLQFRALPTGTYEVTATLLGSGGHLLAIARQQVTVVATPRQ